MAALHIMPMPAAPVSWASQDRIDALALRYLRDEKAFGTCTSINPMVRQGADCGSSLIIADQAEITLFAARQPRLLEYRMSALAGQGDIVVLHRRSAEYERYLADYLGIDGVDFCLAGGRHETPLSVRCRNDPAVLSRICDAACKAGGLTLHAYLTTGNVWRLAQMVAETCAVPVSVCGPSSRVSRRANDKLWFADCVRQLLGPHRVPRSFAAYGPAAAVGHVRRLARSSPRVVVKVPHSAGSAGNISLESDYVMAADSGYLRQQLLDLLYARGWRHEYPFLVGIWNCAVECSPSVQMWIPLEQQGPPVAEGIFEQNVAGLHGTFVGASRARLAPGLRDMLIDEALVLGRLLQKLSYFGRCSLDAIVLAQAGLDNAIQWIECNARWGGVSLPMTLAQRLVQHAQAGLVVVQYNNAEIPVQPLHRTLAMLDGLLFSTQGPDRGIILTSPPDTDLSEHASFVAVASEQAEAEALAAEAVKRLGAAPGGALDASYPQ